MRVNGSPQGKSTDDEGDDDNQTVFHLHTFTNEIIYLLPGLCRLLHSPMIIRRRSVAGFFHCHSFLSHNKRVDEFARRYQRHVCEGDGTTAKNPVASKWFWSLVPMCGKNGERKRERQNIGVFRFAFHCEATRSFVYFQIANWRLWLSPCRQWMASRVAHVNDIRRL